MKRETILSEYDTANGVIVSPGKFEAEPIYAPHFYEQGMEGGADDDVSGVWFFNVLPEDRAEFPEIPADVDVITLEDNDLGFVHIGHHGKDEASALLARLEASEEGEDEQEG